MYVRWLSPLCIVLSILVFVFSNRNEDLVLKGKAVQTSFQQQLIKDSTIIAKYFLSDDDRQMLQGLNGSPFFIEIYHGDSIIYWNDQGFIKNSRSGNIILIQSISYQNDKALIQFNENANYENKIPYGKEVNFSDATNETKIGKIKIGAKQIQISISKSVCNPWLKGLAWWCFFIAFIHICFLLAKKIQVGLVKNEFKSTPVVLLVLWLIFVKILHYNSQFLTLISGYFGAEVYNESSLFTPSINHLFLNIGIFSVFTFIFETFVQHVRLKGRWTWLLAFLCGFYPFFIFSISSQWIEGFIMHQGVNLEIEALMEFNTISFVLITAFILLMVLIFQSTQILFEWFHKHLLYSSTKLTGIFTGWLMAFLVWQLLFEIHVPIWIFTLFIASYTLILDAYTENKDKKMTYLIWWIMMFSGFLAVNLFYFGLNKDVKLRTDFLQNYYTEANDSIIGELTKLQDTLMVRQVFEKIVSLEPSSKIDAKDLYQFMFSDSLNDENTSKRTIELFDKKNGNTLFSNHYADYHQINQSLENSHRVGRNIFHNPFDDMYMIKFEIPRINPYNSSWYLFIIQQGKQKSYPVHQPKVEKYKQGFIVFSKGQVIEKNENNQASPNQTLLSKLEENTKIDGYSFVISKPSSQYKLVSWKQISGRIKPISVFSFIFTLTGIILILLALFNTWFNFLPANLSLKFGSWTLLKTKIQVAIILLILLSFFIIGIITAFYFKNLIEANQAVKQKQTTTSVENNIRSIVQSIPDVDQTLFYLNYRLKDLSNIHTVSLSLYDASGALVGSTTKQGTRLRIPAYYAPEINKNRHFQVPNTFYEPSDETDYIPIYNTENIPIAFVGVDHHAYINSSGNILDFLSTILNAYIFLFLIAGGIAITISNSITKPLSILTDKLKKFKLGKTNEPLEWHSQDEIGNLIRDYNNLTTELERSAGLLAKTERDIAWREMAKQVAHEIKNPLTPMKLSIQYLDRVSKDDPEKSKELIPRISATLIEQIDNLSQIANEFSNFASMPQANNEKIILNEIVETIHDLFRKRDDMDINMIEPIDDLYVFADRNHLVRILNNLLKNAIQAIPDQRRGKIEIELYRKGNDAVISISDNGIGIADHMKEKVFTPNFTTKSSGTGLGLAISANMIESFNGKIYFETVYGQGTTFFISIPLMRLDDYFQNENRVVLD